MKRKLQRRDFIKLGTLLGSTALLEGRRTLLAVSPPSATGDTYLKKSLKFTMVSTAGLSVLERFRLIKEAGFQGVEMDSPSDLDRDEVIEARDETGLEIPGVIDSIHWRQTLSDPDPAVRAAGIAGLETALSDAQAYGSSTVLLVPAVVNEEVSYEKAYRRSQAEIRKVLPLAQQIGVKIAIENVWNNFLLSPLEAARYIDEFSSPWIGFYFDVGNAVNYGWPEQWIRILGKRILKFDIKDYSRELRDKEGPWAGFRVKLGDGSVNWNAVRKAIQDLGYRGWGSAEVHGGNRERIREISERMNRILARE